jgi:hypothetical protein
MSTKRVMAFLMLLIGLSSAIRQSVGTDAEEIEQNDVLVKDVQSQEGFSQNEITQNLTLQAAHYISEQDSALINPRPMCDCIEEYRGSDWRISIDNCFWCRYKSMYGLIRDLCKQCNFDGGESVYYENWYDESHAIQEKIHCSRGGRDDKGVWAKVGSTYGHKHYLNQFTCPSTAVNNFWSTVAGLLAPYRSQSKVKLMYMSSEPEARKYCNDYCAGGSETCTGIVLEYWWTCREAECYNTKVLTCDQQYKDSTKARHNDQVACVKYAVRHNGVLWGEPHHLSFMSCLE